MGKFYINFFFLGGGCLWGYLLKMCFFGGNYCYIIYIIDLVKYKN